ncbi:MAG: 4-amino-4-deoxy-L-arabinose transferase-like glycosyltransferase [Bacteriovoracaceae bacterium]|jgi:4-amino-4-deoxy-L-arabinose transferase-like glycosyltransferase
MKKLFLAAILIFICLLLDLGNPDALRQGTEGFYLKVTEEMFQKDSFLTPYYLGQPHWSKPPFLFLLPQFFYFIQGESSLFLSRLSVLLFSVVLSFLAAKKLSKITGDSPHKIFFFLFATLGFFKYSRIFMMEFPLLILCFLASIYFFSYLQSSFKKDLILSIFFSILSVQVKGPVSLAMLGPAFTLYACYHYLVFRKLYWKEIFIWALSSLILSSFWFLHQYINFGQDFIDYFFLRENLGKFSSKSYPILNVFQGLVLYGLPWTILLPALLWNMRKRGIEELARSKNKFIVFLWSCFLVFFLIWLIPSQRSHHYAIPSLPFLLSIIYFEFFKEIQFSSRITTLFKSYLIALCSLGIFLSIFSISFNDQFPNSNLYILSIGVFLLLGAIALAFYGKSKNIFMAYSHVIVITVFWSVLVPNFLLPLVPVKAIETAKDFKHIGAVHRKPYFISESLSRQVKVLGFDGVAAFLKKEGSAVIIDGDIFPLIDSSSKYKKLHVWNVWRRGIKPGEILRSLKSRELSKLKSNMLIITNP